MRETSARGSLLLKASQPRCPLEGSRRGARDAATRSRQALVTSRNQAWLPQHSCQQEQQPLAHSKQQQQSLLVCEQLFPKASSSYPNLLEASRRQPMLDLSGAMVQLRQPAQLP